MRAWYERFESRCLDRIVHPHPTPTTPSAHPPQLVHMCDATPHCHHHHISKWTPLTCCHHPWSIYLLHHSYQRNKAVGAKASGIVVIIIIGLCCIWNITAEALTWVPGLVEKLLWVKILPLDACECGPAGQGHFITTDSFGHLTTFRTHKGRLRHPVSQMLFSYM